MGFFLFISHQFITNSKQDIREMLMQTQPKDQIIKSKNVAASGETQRKTRQKLNRSQEQLFIRRWTDRCFWCEGCWYLGGSLNPFNCTTGTLSVNLLELHKAVKWNHCLLLKRETDTRTAEGIRNVAGRYEGIKKRISGTWRPWSLGALTQPRHTN